MISLPNNIIEAVNDPETVKVLTTSHKDGSPHIIFHNYLIAVDENTLAYLELFEFSRTYTNLLHHFWDRKIISIGIFNAKRGVNHQIKGSLRRLLKDGPIWNELLGKIWDDRPEANPTGVWLINPLKIINQNFSAILAEIENRRSNYSLWWSYMGEHKLEK